MSFQFISKTMPLVLLKWYPICSCPAFSKINFKFMLLITACGMYQRSMGTFPTGLPNGGLSIGKSREPHELIGNRGKIRYERPVGNVPADIWFVNLHSRDLRRKKIKCHISPFTKFSISHSLWFVETKLVARSDIFCPISTPVSGVISVFFTKLQGPILRKSRDRFKS